MKIIGFGDIGSVISEELAKLSGFEYATVTKEDFPKISTVEEAEEKVPNISLDKWGKNEVYFICSGEEKISGGLLRILEKIKDSKINLVYILRDSDLLSEAVKKQQRAIFKILQNYARSGLFESILCVDEMSLKKSFVTSTNMFEYDKKIGETLAKMINMINWLKGADSFYSEIDQPNEACRMNTLGIFAEQEEKLIFPLDNTRQKDVYFACTEKTLTEDTEFMDKVKETLKSLKTGHEKVEYKIVKTDYEQDFIYLLCHTNFIQ